MDRTRRLFFVIVGIGVLSSAAIVAVNRPAPTTNDALKQSTEEAPPLRSAVATLRLSIASSSTKQNWMEAVTKAFHLTNRQTGKGSSIRVEVSGVLSGDSMLQILDGKLKPVVWSPGSAAWPEQLAEQWRQSGKAPLSKAACTPTIHTPIGLAMWRPMAEALGWPGKPVAWSTIVELATDPNGWARYGHPEWGRLKLGHPHPKYTDAGLQYMASFVYGVTGLKSGLTAQQIYAPAVTNAMHALAQNTSAYGMISTDLLRLMAQNGPRFLHVVSAFEEGMVRLNMEAADRLRWPLAFIFPAEGTFWGNHPYCILDGAEWVSAEAAEAAQIFLDFLLAREQQELAVQHLLRPLDGSIAIEAPLSLANGTDPGVRFGEVAELGALSAEATAAIIDQFMVTKRKSTILLVLDVSGSMQGARIKSAVKATADFLKRLYPSDRVGLMTFNHDTTTISEIRQVSDVVEGLSERVRGLFADGGTNLHGSVCKGMALLRETRRGDVAAGENRLYGMVLLSDGEDTSGQVTENQMHATCLPANAEADGIKVFPIAFGEEAHRKVLARIASVSGGRMFEANLDSIDKAYLRISAEQ